LHKKRLNRKRLPAVLGTAVAVIGLAATPALADTTPASSTVAPVVQAAVGQVAVETGGDVHVDIVGGHAADEFPGMASLEISVPGDANFHRCGAYLSSSRQWAATNAHCVTVPPDGVHLPTNTPLDPALFHLRIGSRDRTTGGEIATITAILPHADWLWGAIPGAPVSDIALLRLDHYVQRQPFEILPKTRPSAPVLEIGWGSTEPDRQGPLPTMLQALKTRLLSPDKCASNDLPITAGELCMDNPNGTDGTCAGDSGSPALQRIDKRWAVIGSDSRGGDFCGTTPTIYTDVTFYRPWIFEVMRTGTVPPSTRPPTNLSAKSLAPNLVHSYRWAAKDPINCTLSPTLCKNPRS
jgi:hypothetical protein